VPVKLLAPAGQPEGVPSTFQASFLLSHATACVQVSGSKRLVSRMAAPEPNPACLVCGMAQAHLAVDTNRMTLQQLVDKVLTLGKCLRLLPQEGDVVAVASCLLGCSW
jgi:hypothetical protein